MSKPNIEKTLPREADLPELPATDEMARSEEPTTPQELAIYAPVLQLAHLQKLRNLPDADFARVVKFDYSGSVWAKIKAGKHNGQVGKAVTAVKRALSLAQTGRVIEADGDIVIFDHVLDAEAAVQLALAARDEHRIALVVGPSGSGKSKTLEFLHRKYGGDFLNGHPDWSHSYMSVVEDFADGIGLAAQFRSARTAQRAILADLKARPRLICVDEANYFNRDGLNLIKAIANETRCALALGTLPDDLRRLNAEHNHETRQVIRRAVAIIPIPQVDSSMVSALHCARYPKLVLNSHGPGVASLANKYHRIDTVVRVFEETDPEDASDLLLAMQRVERAIKVEGIK